MCREGGLDLGLFKGLRRGAPFYRTEPPQLCKPDDGGGLAAQVDDLLRLGRIRVLVRSDAHRFHRTGHRSGGPDGTLRRKGHRAARGR